MYTLVYWPEDSFSRATNVHYGFVKGDHSVQANNWQNEGPSFCVRLLVFDYNDCLD